MQCTKISLADLKIHPSLTFIRPLPEGGLFKFVHVLGVLGFLGFSTFFSTTVDMIYNRKSVPKCLLALWEGPQLLLAKVKDANRQDWYIC